MPTDDILWKKIDSLISEQTEKAETAMPAPQPPLEDVQASAQTQCKPASAHASNQAGRRASRPANKSQSSHASTLSSTSPCHPSEWVEATRKVVKMTGKEVAFARLTAQEKERLSDTVYGLRRRGIRTSENEVLRIAINQLLEDFDAGGDASFLRRVIAALLA